MQKSGDNNINGSNVCSLFFQWSNEQRICCTGLKFTVALKTRKITKISKSKVKQNKSRNIWIIFVFHKVNLIFDSIRFPGRHHIYMKKVCSFTLIIYFEQTNKQIKRTYEMIERNREGREEKRRKLRMGVTLNKGIWVAAAAQAAMFQLKGSLVLRICGWLHCTHTHTHTHSMHSIHSRTFGLFSFS